MNYSTSNRQKMILVISFIAILLFIYFSLPRPEPNPIEQSKSNFPSPATQEIVPKQKIEELKTKYDNNSWKEEEVRIVDNTTPDENGQISQRLARLVDLLKENPQGNDKTERIGLAISYIFDSETADILIVNEEGNLTKTVNSKTYLENIPPNTQIIPYSCSISKKSTPSGHENIFLKSVKIIEIPN
jgi:hypothetical protein